MTNFSGEAEDAIGDSVAYLSRSHRACLERECARDAMQDLIGRRISTGCLSQSRPKEKDR